MLNPVAEKAGTTGVTERSGVVSPRLYQVIARRIDEMIRQGGYAAGDRLPGERELAQRLGVSRPSVREAVIALEVAGVVEVRTGSGVTCGCQRRRGAARGDLPGADLGPGPYEALVYETPAFPIYNQRMDIELSTRSAAHDVINVTFIYSGRWVGAGWTTPLDEFLDDPKKIPADFDPKDFLPGTTAAFKDAKGGLHAIPRIASPARPSKGSCRARRHWR
ncbi:MAG TPA: GntR family transcriptional regulator [Stellaceae bacterium]|nr:GntR family transcriptional regulator [Stellaceae bacterium]